MSIILRRLRGLRRLENWGTKIQTIVAYGHAGAGHLPAMCNLRTPPHLGSIQAASTSASMDRCRRWTLTISLVRPFFRLSIPSQPSNGP